jgi:uncharacterized protein (TIGR02217 family)
VAEPFLEERLPVGIQMGATYGDDFQVEITKTASGREYRRLVHPYPVRHYSITYIATAPELWNKLIALYHRCYGMYAGFRVKAMDDFTTNANTAAPTALDQPLKRVSAGVYQLQKQYGAGASPLSIGLPVRTIYKPVAGTVKCAVNGVTTTAFSVDATTGLVTFTSDPGAGADVTGGCEFDIPFRFNSQITLSHVAVDLRETQTIEIVELIAI